MNQNELLDLTAELGYRLAMNGAETFRIEECIKRIMSAYSIHAEVFAIPNCLHISITSPDGTSITKMRRIGYHGNDLDAVEQYSNLSRRICSETPSTECFSEWLQQANRSLKTYPLWLYLLGNFFGGCGFSILFGGSIQDSICAGLCGIVIGIVNKLLEHLKVNPFFRTIAASFFMALVAYATHSIGIAQNPDTVIIGALMILVPGLVFTNAMRDIIYGDTNSGINRIVQVILVAVAIAVGTGSAWTITAGIREGLTASALITYHLWFEALACFIACCGFVILFNIHGLGRILCAIGGVIAWICYRIVVVQSGSDIFAYFVATVVVAFYSEIMARVRKAPAIPYLVISIFPLIPGAGVYYTMNYALHNNMQRFASQGFHTAAIAGVIAVGILLSSTTVRIITPIIMKYKKTRV